MEVGVNNSTRDVVSDIKANEMGFYVVSAKKFIILFVGTLGVYSLYWFYKNWSNYKKETGDKVWPVARSFFSIFFVHSLFQKMRNKYIHQTGRNSKNVNNLATIYVLIYIISNVSDRLAGDEVGSPYTDYISIMLLPIICWALYKAQLLANIACGDANGDTNNRLTALNYLWLALGGAFWVLILWGLTL
ncbi:hypothetical protein [Psychromonas antarctica]|jgi:hypothetical protein|uniref:hypothetical protein n=1 Tax=Psychromonas antarctica TaxID=67573 RepID=UPI001EE7CB15|nr:hypothetical protein [Psychromonas antarctica]MCG6202926.1 hypothetical protein [Psychromonas antarctica]